MSNDLAKSAAAMKALELVKPGMVIGLGTGSTTAFFIRALGQRVKAGLDIQGIPTSEGSAALAREVGIPLGDINRVDAVDLTVDGADEIDAQLQMIKGGGGALLRERIVASASHHVVIIADESKVVRQLGKFPLPIEITPFAAGLTGRRIAEMLSHFDIRGEIRMRPGKEGPGPFLTDNRNLILDCALEVIAEPGRIAHQIEHIPGVVTHGFFLGMADIAIIGSPEGTRILEAKS